MRLLAQYEAWDTTLYHAPLQAAAGACGGRFFAYTFFFFPLTFLKGPRANSAQGADTSRMPTFRNYRFGRDCKVCLMFVSGLKRVFFVKARMVPGFSAHGVGPQQACSCMTEGKVTLSFCNAKQILGVHFFYTAVLRNVGWCGSKDANSAPPLSGMKIQRGHCCDGCRWDRNIGFTC